MSKEHANRSNAGLPQIAETAGLERELSVGKPASPGIQPLIKSQPAPVQRRSLTSRLPQREIPEGPLEDWTNAVFRPDLHRPPVSRKRVSDVGRPDITQASPATGSGQPMPADVQAKMEQSFGSDFSAVRIHEGDGVAEQHNALAVTQGSDIHFAHGQGLEDRFLLGHELAHVVQQRGGTAGAQAKREGGDETSFLEAEADEAGRRIAAREPVPAIVGRAGVGVYKFGAGEHRDMGDAGSGKRTVRLADDYTLTYGQVTALAGDHFESLEQMRTFAAKKSGPESREEIEYALEWQLGEKGRTYSKEAKKAQETRYYTLAGKNDVHFPNPNAGDTKATTAEKAADIEQISFLWVPLIQKPKNAIAAYRMNHIKAINEALKAGKAGKPIDRAMLADAFGSHYLTDCFSGGHIRTERTAIRAYWNAKVPMFYYNFTGYLSEKIAEQLNGMGGYNIMSEDMLVTGPPGMDGSYGTVKSKVGGMGRLDFGDIVALALHDYDNALGVDAVSEGKDVKLMGDGNAGKGDEKALAIRAVQLSVADIDRAYALGKAGSTNADELIGNDGLFAAERVIPSPASGPGKNAHNPAVDWRKPDALTLLRDPLFQPAVAKFCQEKANVIQDVADSLGGAKKTALERAVIQKLNDPAQCVEMVWQVINWTPDTGGGAIGQNTDSNAEDYYDQAAKTPGGVQTLTKWARAKLIFDMLGGVKVWKSEEQSVWYLLDYAPIEDARWCIQQIGWDRLADELEDGEDTKFRAKFPRDQFGK